MSDKKKTITIIMVSYNEKEYINKAIASCINQEKTEGLELIIGDDGSSDGSIELIKSYAIKYPETIKYFVMDRTETENIIPSIRVSEIFKKGISIASGKYIVLMSADDLLLNRKRLYVQKKYLDEHPSTYSCYTDFIEFWPDGQKRIVKSSASYSRAVFWGSHYVHISCFMFRREVSKKFLKSFCDDIGAVFSILKYGKCDHIKHTGFAYRQRDKSIMHSADEMEIPILELLLFQDILNDTDPIFDLLSRFSTLARFSKSLGYVLVNRKGLEAEKYGKYRALASSKDYDILTGLNKVENSILHRIWYYSIYFISKISYFVFWILKVIEVVISSIF